MNRAPPAKTNGSSARNKEREAVRIQERLAALRKTVREHSVPDIADFVRYLDPETGKTWCGLGRPPNWIRGKDRETFRVKDRGSKVFDKSKD